MPILTIRMLKLFSLMVASSLAISLPHPSPVYGATSNAANSETSIVMNGIIRNNSVLTPLRQLAESLGFTVQWHSESRSITVTKGNKTILLSLDQPTAYVNGKPVELDIAPLLNRDLTVVPVRFVSEAFGATVKWDNETRRVIINDHISIVMEPNEGDLNQMIAASGSDPYLRPLISYVTEDTITVKSLLTADLSDSGEQGYTTFTFSRSSTGWSISKVDIEHSKAIDFQLNENEAIFLTKRKTTDTILKAHGSYAFTSDNNNMKWTGDSFMFTTQTPKGEYRTVLVNSKTGHTAEFSGFTHQAPQIAKTLGP